MAAAVNTIANDGVYIEPSIIDGQMQTDAGTIVGLGRGAPTGVWSAPTPPSRSPG